MVKKSERVKVTLDDGTTIVPTTAVGWDEDSEKDGSLSLEKSTFLCPGWKAARTPHKAIVGPLLKAFVKVMPEVQIGTYQEKPVYDVEKVFSIMVGDAIEKYGLDIEKSVATARVGATKKLAALEAAIKELDPEIAKQLGL